MYLTNQAMFGAWQELNAPNQANDTQWRTYLYILNLVMQTQLGEELSDIRTFEDIKDADFEFIFSINSKFVHEHQVDISTRDALWNDEFYGLKESVNYYHWNNLLYTTDELKTRKKLFWFWELKTYFGLNFDQIYEMEGNWNQYFSDAKTQILEASVPSGDKNVTNYAYWQWAKGLGSSPDASIVDVTNSGVTGYPEFIYWLDSYCNPSEGAAMTDDNWNVFKDVKMYRDDSTDPT